MIRDGRMPSPECPRQVRAERRQKRRRQPAVQRRQAERRQRDEEWNEASAASWRAEFAEKAEVPLYDLMHEIFDFADPELWRSNSFAALYPRLLVHVKAAVAKLRIGLCDEDGELAALRVLPDAGGEACGP
jgi:hypothetical protein